MDNTVNFHDVRKRSRMENQFEGESPSASTLSDSVKPTAQRVRETVKLGQLDNIEPTNPSSSTIRRSSVTHFADNSEQRFAWCAQKFAQAVVKLLQPSKLPKSIALWIEALDVDATKRLALCIEAFLKKCPKESRQEALKEALIAVLDTDLFEDRNIKENLINILVEKGARITQNEREHVRVYSYETALMVAIRCKDVKATHDLLARANTNVDRKTTCFNDTALMYAACFGNLEALQTLLERGVDIHHKDRYGKTALMHAVDGYKLEPVQILLARGADVNQKDNEGRTVLTYAIIEYSHQITIGQSAKYMQIIRALVERGADVNETLTFLTEQQIDNLPEQARASRMRAMWIVARDLLDDHPS